ncbi:MAG TPA: zinc ribbon domain-containing protein [Pyrinomonadaceae bacterium]|jgi:hypothetical protein
MTENPVENPVCNACGAPVRPQALFCYNCGSSLAPEIEKTDLRDKATGATRQREEIFDENNAKTQPLTDAVENFDAPIAKPSEMPVEDGADKIPPAPAETKLKSAASLRRSARTPAQKKTVEVIWDEPESASNVWFLVAALVLALFAVGILLAMLYIR